MSAENQSSKVATAGFTPREMEIAFLAWRAIDSGGSDLKVCTRQKLFPFPFPPYHHVSSLLRLVRNTFDYSVS